jgi:hypothetical protein
MKKLIIALVAVVVLVGCVAPWARNPDTGEIPIVEGLKEAADPATSGNWLGAAVALVVTTAISCFATKKRKDGQIAEIVAAVEKYKSLDKEGAIKLMGELSGHMSGGTKGLVKKLRGKLAALGVEDN